MAKAEKITPDTANNVEPISEFLKECDEFCAAHGIKMSYLSNLALSQTYALKNLATKKGRIDSLMARVRAKMAEMNEERSSKQVAGE